ALTEYGVNDLRAGFDDATVRDHRAIIYFSRSRQIKITAPLNQAHMPDSISKQVVMHLQITCRRADVDPISLLRHVCVEGFAARKQVGEEVVFKRMALVRRNEIEQARLQDIRARVDRVHADLIGLRLLKKTTHAPVPFSLNQTIRARILNRRKHNRGRRLTFFVLFDDSFKIEIGQDVPVEDDRALADQLFGKLVRAGRAHRLRLGRVLDLHAVLRTVAQELFDLDRLIRKRERDVSDTGAAQRVYLIKQKRPVADRHNRLRRIDRERAQARALAASENQCLHSESVFVELLAATSARAHASLTFTPRAFNAHTRDCLLDTP